MVWKLLQARLDHSYSFRCALKSHELLGCSDVTNWLVRMFGLQEFGIDQGLIIVFERSLNIIGAS